ncbi:MAG: hypothetical protein ACRENF_01260, partial [Thermodesulfobacteriota bacterium]
FDIVEGAGSSNTIRTRLKPIQDDPVQSPNSSAVIFFDRLYYLTDDHNYRHCAEATLKYFGNVAERYGLFAASYFVALHHHIKHPAQVVVVGENGDSKVQDLLKAAWSIYRPHKVVIRIDTQETEIANLSDTIREIAKIKSPCACVCAGNSCAEPTDSPDVLSQMIRTFSVR